MIASSPCSERDHHGDVMLTRTPCLMQIIVHVLGLVHIVMMVALLERFVLCMHYSEHRPIFKKKAHNRLFSGLVTVVRRTRERERDCDMCS